MTLCMGMPIGWTDGVLFASQARRRNRGDTRRLAAKPHLARLRTDVSCTYEFHAFDTKEF
jgi:hypothetical protein